MCALVIDGSSLAVAFIPDVLLRLELLQQCVLFSVVVVRSYYDGCVNWCH